MPQFETLEQLEEAVAQTTPREIYTDIDRLAQQAHEQMQRLAALRQDRNRTQARADKEQTDKARGEAHRAAEQYEAEIQRVVSKTLLQLIEELTRMSACAFLCLGNRIEDLAVGEYGDEDDEAQEGSGEAEEASDDDDDSDEEGTPEEQVQILSEYLALLDQRRQRVAALLRHLEACPVSEAQEQTTLLAFLRDELTTLTEEIDARQQLLEELQGSLETLTPGPGAEPEVLPVKDAGPVAEAHTPPDPEPVPSATPELPRA